MILRTQDIEIICQSINELVNGIGIPEIKIRVGRSVEEVKEFDLKLRNLIEGKEHSTETIKVEWTCSEMQLAKSLLCELLKELDHFEFEARLGFSEDEVWVVLKTIREHLDTVCYPKSQ